MVYEISPSDIRRYRISDAQNDMGSDLGIELRLSENKRKLIDVYRNGEFFCSVGASNFKYFREWTRDTDATTAVYKRNKILARYKNDGKLETLYMLRLLWCCE